MPTTSVAQCTCAVSNLGFIYIYELPIVSRTNPELMKLLVGPIHQLYAVHFECFEMTWEMFLLWMNFKD